MLNLASQFLGWWRKWHVGDEYAISPRAACPDHQLRCMYRDELDSFLRFMSGAR
ncbi:hypothetical protein [Noviherbaspirillum cavernae]|uniref:hypothetical protein n=1 Tax=Noviherbaspirillum cavernae TaxID=2320862 RepID=UPI00131402A2|nr:hypothetical protein [Noviherbaspirillum cavernae]